MKVRKTVKLQYMSSRLSIDHLNSIFKCVGIKFTRIGRQVQMIKYNSKTTIPVFPGYHLPPQEYNESEKNWGLFLKY